MMFLLMLMLVSLLMSEIKLSRGQARKIQSRTHDVDVGVDVPLDERSFEDDKHAKSKVGLIEQNIARMAKGVLHKEHSWANMTQEVSPKYGGYSNCDTVSKHALRPQRITLCKKTLLKKE